MRLATVLSLLLLCAGCAAHRPIEGIPVSHLPEEHLQPAPHRSGGYTIDLSLLRRTPPREHRVDADDILGVYVEGVLGDGERQVPVYAPHDGRVPPAMGYPVKVAGDGTISLPWVDPVNVRGLTLREVEERIRAVYSRGERPLLRDRRARVLVSLQKPRTARVLVIRQEGGNRQGNAPDGDAAGDRQKRGTGSVVALPVYRNDVLHALAETGGLPGTDAENVIYVIRRGQQGAHPMHGVPPAPAVEPAGRAGGMARFADRSWPDSPMMVGNAQSAGLPRPTGIAVYDLPPPGTGHSVDVCDSGSDGEPSIAGWTRLPDEDRSLSGPAWIGNPSCDAATAEPGFVQTIEAEPPLAPGVIDSRETSPPLQMMVPWHGAPVWEGPTIAAPRVIRIPLRLHPGEVPAFGEEDITLQDGDVVFVESRETEFFMTGGLLGGGKLPLPRDYDIDVIDAIAIAERAGANANRPTRSLGGVSALNQDVTVGASRVIIQRKLPNGYEVPIEVDLYKAIRDPGHRVIIQPGDRLILQYTHSEAFAAFLERHLLDPTIFGLSSAAAFNN